MSLHDRIVMEGKKKAPFRVAPKADWAGPPRENMLKGLKAYGIRLDMLAGTTQAQAMKHKVVGKVWKAIERLKAADKAMFQWVVANYNGGAPLYLSETGLKKHFAQHPPAAGTTEWVPDSALAGE